MDNLDIRQIAESGQIFRFNEVGEGRYELLAGDRRLDIDTRRPFTVPDGFWSSYFDLETDYSRFINAIPESDEFLTAAARYGSGMRILRQDPWEMLISFIISQRKSIPAIKTSVEKLCERFGTRMDGYYAFPTPQQLERAEIDELFDCSLGYRAPYVYECARRVASGEYDLKAWEKLDDEELRARLMSIRGVGIKVANCVMLFGYHRIGAFPVDVWIQRVVDEHYGGHFPLELYEGFAGVIQQYMFFYGRNAARPAGKPDGTGGV